MAGLLSLVGIRKLRRGGVKLARILQCIATRSGAVLLPGTLTLLLLIALFKKAAEHKSLPFKGCVAVESASVLRLKGPTAARQGQQNIRHTPALPHLLAP